MKRKQIEQSSESTKKKRRTELENEFKVDPSQYSTQTQTRNMRVRIHFCEAENDAWVEAFNYNEDDKSKILVSLLKHGILRPENITMYYLQHCEGVRDVMNEIRKNGILVDLYQIEQHARNNFDYIICSLTKLTFTRNLLNSTLLQCSDSVVHGLLSVFPLLVFRGLKSRATIEHFVKATTGSIRLLNMVDKKIFKKFTVENLIDILSVCQDIGENSETIKIFERIPEDLLITSPELMTIFFDNVKCLDAIKIIFSKHKHLVFETMKLGKISALYYPDDLMSDCDFLDDALKINGFELQYKNLPESAMTNRKVILKFVSHDSFLLDKIPFSFLSDSYLNGILRGLVMEMVKKNTRLNIHDFQHNCENKPPNKYSVYKHANICVLKCSCGKFSDVVPDSQQCGRLVLFGKSNLSRDPEIQYLKMGYKLPRYLNSLKNIKFNFE